MAPSSIRDVRRDASPRTRQAGKWRRHEAAVHDVVVHLHVLLRRPDVDPVAVVDVGDESLIAFDERREVAPLDRPRDFARNPVEGIRLEDVDAGIDVVRRDFLGLGLLDESLDVALPVGLHQPVRGRVVHWREHDGGAGLALAVHADHRSQVQLRHDVAIEHDDRLGELVASVFDCSRRAQRYWFDDVSDLDAQIGAVAEHLLDAARLVVEAEDDFVDLRDLLQQIDLVMQKRPVEDRNDGLGRMNRQRPETRALAPCEKDSLHDNPQSYTMVECPRRMNLPNTLTLVRMFLVPLLVVVLLTEFEGRQIFGVPKELAGAAIFGLASLTDWLDGYIARRRRQITWLGQMLDPIADKLLTSAAFISLVQLDLAPAWMVALIIGREFAVTALRSLAYTKGITIPASPLGKIKMASQVTAILLLILGWRPLPWLAPIGHVALWVVMAGRSRIGR